MTTDLTTDLDQHTKTLDKAHVFHSWSAQAALDPLVVAGGLGCRVWDHAGRTYLDFSSQLVNVNIGHQHPAVVRAIRTAFSIASAPPLVKNTLFRPAGARSVIRRAASPRVRLAVDGAMVASVAACSWMARTTAGCWWPMLTLTSWLEKSR